MPESATIRRSVAAAVLTAAVSFWPATVKASVWVPEGTAHTATDTPAEQDAKMGWWREARFGMFIHWGIYSLPAGEWNGSQIGGLGEWIIKSASIPVADYQALALRFNPTSFNAEKWVAAAKSAGMKYIIITAKHHDGFAMFHSKIHSFNIYDATPFKRDPLAELAAACRKAGMRFGFYYSHDQDWTAPGGAVIGRTWDKAQDGNFENYLRTKSLPQFKELLANYQPAPDIIWFDTPTTEMTPDLATEFINLLKQHPQIIWNERLGGGFKGNFRTPENYIPATGPADDWEICMTMNNSWGFKKNDHSWKSTEVLVRNLIDVASKGGNYLLNIGPDAEGVIPAPSVDRLNAIGAWLTTNGEAIYGTTSSPFGKQPPWGRITRKGNTLYLHVFKWPQDGKIILPAANRMVSARMLADPKAGVEVSPSAQGLEIRLPASAPDPIASVVALVFQEPVEPILPPAISQREDGSLVLAAQSADLNGDDLRLEEPVVPAENPNIGYWSDPGESAEWAIEITRPGMFTVSMDYACDDKSAGGEIQLTASGQKLPVVVEGTGGWKNYRTVTLGQIRLEKATRVTVVLKGIQKTGPAFLNLRSMTLSPPIP